jgi:hypothetical protein
MALFWTTETDPWWRSSEHDWNVGHSLPDYTAQRPRRQSCSCLSPREHGILAGWKSAARCFYAWIKPQRAIYLVTLRTVENTNSVRPTVRCDTSSAPPPAVLWRYLHSKQTCHILAHRALTQLLSRCCHFSSFANLEFTERRGRVVSTPASYLGGPGFKSWPGDRLSWLRFFVVFLSRSRRMPPTLDFFKQSLPFRFSY